MHHFRCISCGIVVLEKTARSDHFLVDVSRYIKAHPDSAKQIEYMHHIYSPSIEFERALKDFIRE